MDEVRFCAICQADVPVLPGLACYADGCFRRGSPRLVVGKHRARPPWPPVSHAPERVWVHGAHIAALR